MPVRLVPSSAAEASSGYSRWAAVDTTSVGLPPTKRIGDLGGLLATALRDVRADWLALGRRLSEEPSADLAHAPSCAANVSDFGLMLAWSRLIAAWAAADDVTLIVVDDPWLFRAWRSIEGVQAGKGPLLWARAAVLVARGYVARTKVALAVFAACSSLRIHRDRHRRGCAALLVYGHPNSTPAGDDGYFGPLMNRVAGLVRLLHVDCPIGRARELESDRRTASLHAWGSLAAALVLPFAKWRPRSSGSKSSTDWLVRRAAAREGATGQAAMVRWQQICQARWLSAVKPCTVAWPWENHAWERRFVSEGRKQGVRVIGYQHATIGRQEFNYSPATNANGDDSVPDVILTTGAIWREMLHEMGYPLDRIRIGGALRLQSADSLRYDSAAPIFVALPSDHVIAGEMIDALRPLARPDQLFLVKDHPMAPHDFRDSAYFTRTDKPLNAQGRLSGVVYSATTVGLEAVLAGLPTIQFLPASKIALDVMPDGVGIPSADAADLDVQLANRQIPQHIDRTDVFAEPDLTIWSELLDSESTAT